MAEPRQDEGMMPLAEFEAALAAREDPAPEPVPSEEELLTRVSEERLRELKRQARAQIEERLRAKRRQRRLLRGADW